MKRVIFSCLICFVFIGVQAQDVKSLGDKFSQLKKEGKLSNSDEFIVNPNAKGEGLQITHPSKKRSHNANRTMSSTACNCWIPRDSSFHIVAFDGSGQSGPPQAGDPNYANDDWSTDSIHLPFNFCLYGNTVGNVGSAMYINNNGNISFGAPYPTFSAVAFPSSTYTMVAPFWGDVETSNPGSGFVHYQLTSSHLIIQWDSVTHYQSSPGEDHLVNTFQLILTDGIDPILPAGNNISFCYGEMQWTTGDASGGSGGFGGTPATVGINKGDGVNYVQISLFGNSGSTFTNPSGSPASGVNWLVNKSFYFDACGSGTNLPPLSTTGGSVCGGDTLNICAVGDTLTQLVQFTGPEPSQHVTVTASAPTIGSGFSVVSSTVGTTGSLIFQVASGGLTAGNYYNVSVTGTDNGSPVQSTTINYVIHILNAPIPSPSITVNPAITCGNTPAVISLANSSSYDSYTWSTGATTYSISVATTSTVQVTVTKNGCSKTGSAVAYFYPKPIISIGGALSFCMPAASNTNIYVNQPVTGGTAPFSYAWNTGASTYSLQAVSGTYSVMVTDAHGCKDSSTVNVNSTSVPTLSITSKGSLCATPSVDTLIASITGASSYVWTPGLGSPNYTYTVNMPGSYSLAVIINGCSVSATYSLSPPITPTVTVSGNLSLCSGDSTKVNVSAIPAGTYSYVWYNGSSIIGTNVTQTIYTTGNYSVAAINNNTQCKNAQVFTVNSYTNPVVSINGNQTYCKTSLLPDSLTAVVTGGNAPYNYSWSPSSPTVTTYTYAAMPPSNATSITYSVIVTDSKGCKAVAQILLKQSNPHLAIANPSVCPGYTIGVTANGSGTAPLTYTWTDLANGQQVFGKHDVLSPGKYTVAMTDVYGCSVIDTVKVGLNAVPNANFSYAPQSVEQGVPVSFINGSIIATGSITANSWTFGDTGTASISNPTHVYNSGGSFSVSLIVKSDKGCLDTVTEVISIQYVVVAPNIITPNGDGINEMLAFKNLQYFKNNKLQIFNRWGTRLYQDNDYKNNWSGKDYSDGTYFYILEIPEKHKTLNGFFENIK